MEITSKTVVSTKEIAIILGVTARWVQQLTQDGILPGLGRNNYNLAETIKAYLDFRSREEPIAEELERKRIELSLQKAKAVVMEMEAEELQRKMHRAKDVEAMTNDLVSNIETKIISLPELLAERVSKLDDPAEVAEIIRTEVFAIMSELSNYQYEPEVD